MLSFTVVVSTVGVVDHGDRQPSAKEALKYQSGYGDGTGVGLPAMVQQCVPTLGTPLTWPASMVRRVVVKMVVGVAR